MQHIKCKNSCKVLSLHSGFFWIFCLKFPMKICWWEIRRLFASEGKALLCLKSDCSCGSCSKHIPAAFAGGLWAAGAMDLLPHSLPQGSGGPAGQLKHVAWKSTGGWVGGGVGVGKLDHHKQGKRSSDPRDHLWMSLWFVEQVEGDSPGGRWSIMRLLPWFTVKEPFAVVLGFCSITWLRWKKLSFVDSSELSRTFNQ